MLSKITEQEYIDLCKHVRGDKNEISEWKEVEDLSWDAKNPIVKIPKTINVPFLNALENDDLFPIKLYINHSKKKAVLAFSSTQLKPSQLWADFLLAIRNKTLPVVLYHFNIVKNRVDELVGSYNLSCTGFSLGAVLAEVFAAKFKLQAVTFDSPGSKNIIENLGKDISVAGIETYLTAPSQINTLDCHVGKIYRLVLDSEAEKFNPKISQLNSFAIKFTLNKKLPWYFASVGATLDYAMESILWMKGIVSWSSGQHSLESMEENCIDGNTGSFKNSCCIQMQSWPTRLALFNFNYKKLHQQIQNNSDIRLYDVLIQLPGYRQLVEPLSFKGEEFWETDSKEFQNDFFSPNVSTMINQLVNDIGSETYLELGNTTIDTSEVRFSISDPNRLYSADFINILTHRYSSDNSIRTYPAISADGLASYIDELEAQPENYAFIPLNVAYDKHAPQQKNHWIALILDKQNKLVFYLDPAQKPHTDQKPSKEVDHLKEALQYQEPIITTPINFQQKEQQEGWLRHCGLYVVEIFEKFAECIQNGQVISGSHLPNPSVPNSQSLLVALSKIACGDAENIHNIRGQHIQQCQQIITKAETYKENKNVLFDSSQEQKKEPKTNAYHKDTYVEIKIWIGLSNGKESRSLTGITSSFFGGSSKNSGGHVALKIVENGKETHYISIHPAGIFKIGKPAVQNKTENDDIHKMGREADDSIKLYTLSIEQIKKKWAEINAKNIYYFVAGGTMMVGNFFDCARLTWELLHSANNIEDYFTHHYVAFPTPNNVAALVKHYKNFENKYLKEKHEAADFTDVTLTDLQNEHTTLTIFPKPRNP